MAAQVAALRAADPAALMPRLACPVLALLAEEDLLIPLAPARAALAAIPRVTVQTIPQSGHSVHWDAPEATLAALIPFLEGA
jgi:pimeloyl-ACP methyl ester carboxylesterase